MTAWIAALIALCVGTRAPAVDPRVPDAIAAVAHLHPLLFDGRRDVVKTAALLTAISHREGHFDPAAVGKDGLGESYGLGQVHETNLKRLHVTREEMLDPYKNLLATAQLLEESLRVCADAPAEERLTEYAAGRGDCTCPEGVADSRNRTALMEYLLRARPVFWAESRETIMKPSHERH
jgi:hypothetical protein